MLKTTFKPRLGEPSPTLATLPELLDEYATYARRVRDLAGENVKQQLTYINRFFTNQSISSPDELFQRLSPAYVQQFVFDYASECGPQHLSN